MGMRKFPFASLAAALLVTAVSACLVPSSNEGGRSASVGGAVKAAVFRREEPRLLPVYVVGRGGALPKGGSAEALYIEGLYIPQAAAAYYPTRFSFSEKGRRLMFLADLSYRVLDKADLGSGVTVYTVETSAAASEGSGARRYTVSFARSALGSESGESTQPAPYALERGARLSGLASGTARLESLRFDEKSGLFRAVVVVSPTPE